MVGANRAILYRKFSCPLCRLHRYAHRVHGSEQWLEAIAVQDDDIADHRATPLAASVCTPLSCLPSSVEISRLIALASLACVWTMTESMRTVFSRAPWESMRTTLGGTAFIWFADASITCSCAFFTVSFSGSSSANGLMLCTNSAAPSTLLVMPSHTPVTLSHMPLIKP